MNIYVANAVTVGMRRALTIWMEFSVIPGRIQMERFIPVESFRKKGNTFRGISFFYGALLVPYTRAYSFILGMYLTNTFLPLARLFLSGATLLCWDDLFCWRDFFRWRDFFSLARPRSATFFSGPTFWYCRPLDLLPAQVTNTCSYEQDGWLGGPRFRPCLQGGRVALLPG